jgi:hypothetical protein
MPTSNYDVRIMGRILSVKCNNGKVLHEGNKVNLDDLDVKSDVELDLSIHLDGGMKDFSATISSDWLFAPQTLLIYSSDNVEIPANRLGGKIAIPPRVVGFDPRKIQILATWSKQQIKTIGTSLQFRLGFEYPKEGAQTLLVNSGRGLKGSAQADLGCKIITEGNLQYLPVRALERLGRFRIRGFSDSSLHIDEHHGSKKFEAKLSSYDFNSNFMLTDSNYNFSDVARSKSGLPVPKDESEGSMLASCLKDLMSITCLNYAELSKDHRSEVRAIISSISDYISKDIISDKVSTTTTDNLMASIGLIRAGLLVGGRSGKKLMDRGIIFGQILEESPSIVEDISGRLLIKNSIDSNKYKSRDQVFSIAALIYMKKGGFSMKKKDLREKITGLKSGLRLFKSDHGFFKNLDHLFSDALPVKNSNTENEILLTSLEWADKITF